MGSSSRRLTFPTPGQKACTLLPMSPCLVVPTKTLIVSEDRSLLFILMSTTAISITFTHSSIDLCTNKPIDPFAFSSRRLKHIAHARIPHPSITSRRNRQSVLVEALFRMFAEPVDISEISHDIGEFFRSRQLRQIARGDWRGSVGVGCWLAGQ